MSFSRRYRHPVVLGAEIDGDHLNESGVGTVDVSLHVSTILWLDDAIEEELHNIVKDEGRTGTY